MMRFGHMIAAAIIFFALASPVWAEKVRYLSPEDMTVKLRLGETMRVIFPAPVQKVLPISSDLSLKPDGGALYISPMTPNVSRTLWVTAGGKTYALKVAEGDPPDETAVVVSLDTKTNRPSADGDEGVLPASPAACLLRDLAGGDACPGAVRKKERMDVIYEDAFMRIVAAETLNIGHLTGLKAVVINRLPSALRLDARRFEFVGAVAIALGDQWLPPSPKGKTFLYVIVDDRL